MSMWTQHSLRYYHTVPDTLDKPGSHPAAVADIFKQMYHKAETYLRRGLLLSCQLQHNMFNQGDFIIQQSAKMHCMQLVKTLGRPS